jgi:hypothetical protein
MLVAYLARLSKNSPVCLADKPWLNVLLADLL